MRSARRGRKVSREVVLIYSSPLLKETVQFLEDDDVLVRRVDVHVSCYLDLVVDAEGESSALK